MSEEISKIARRIMAWMAASPVGHLNSQEWRIDCDSRLIRWSDFGETTEFGWEIDHVFPSILGGPDDPSNWRARHHSGNRRAGAILGNALQKRPSALDLGNALLEQFGSTEPQPHNALIEMMRRLPR